MFEKQTEKQFVNKVVDQSARQAPSGRLSRNDDGSKGFHTRRRREDSEPVARLKSACTRITIAPRHTQGVGTSPVISEFADPKPLRRLITVCAWCKGAQNVDGFWRHAENAPQTDAQSKVSHGICPECAEKSYNEFRLATFAASSHLASAPTAA